MPKKSDRPLSKHTLNLFAGDYARLMDVYDQAGASRIVRELVRAHLNRIDAKTEQVVLSVNLPNLDLGEILNDDT